MGDQDDSAFHCGQCNEPEPDEEKIIFCDGCQQSFHFSCQGVNDAVKLDDSWMCSSCNKSTTNINLEESAEAIAKELEMFNKNLEKQSQLFKMKLELENKKRELRWLAEKRAVEMKISAEKEYNNKCNAERDVWKQQLMELAADQKQSKEQFDDFLKSIQLSVNKESSGKKRRKKKNRSKKSENADGQQSSKSDSENDEETEDSSVSDENVLNGNRTVKGPTKSQLISRQFHSWKLPTFTGKPDEWPIFISNYRTSTEACGFSNLENMMRLQDAVQGPAREIVGGQLIHPQETPSAIETLQQLYGRPEQILDALLLKVRKAEAPKVERLGSFITFGTIVKQLSAHLEAADLKSHLVNPLLINELVEKLPSSTKLEWVRFRRAKKDVTLRTLSDFLSELVSIASEVVNYAEFSSGNTIKGGKSRSFIGVHESEERSNLETKWPCPICSETNHRIRNCEEFKDMDVDERIEAVEEHNLCKLCLNSHGNIRCKMNIRCNVGNCSERHNYLLHK